MREIKFRAWDGQGFHYWGFIDGAFFGPADGNYGGGFNALTTPHDQFTGLHDADGVEIYEGDILERPLDPERTRIEFEGRKIPIYAHRHVVKWNDEYSQFRGVSLNPYPWNDSIFWPHSGDYRVIGNIHENPELLK